MQTTARSRRGGAGPARGRRDVELRVVRPGRVQATATALALNVAIAGFFALLAAAHLTHGRTTGDWLRVVPVLVQESLLVGLFLVRRPATLTSRRPQDRLAALAGVGLPLGLRPAALPGAFAAVGDALQAAGVAAAVVCLASLGRRVGIVAANRGVATRGPYRLVRHPAYAAYLVCYAGYLVAHPTALNAVLVAAWLAATHARILAEERLLARDPRYARYCERVRGRWVPAGLVGRRPARR